MTSPGPSVIAVMPMPVAIAAAAAMCFTYMFVPSDISMFTTLASSYQDGPAATTATAQRHTGTPLSCLCELST